jgi:serine/threonine protein kinase
MISPAQSVEQLLIAARERSPAERVAFLDNVCRDSPEIRRMVENRLLAEDDESSESTVDCSAPGSTSDGSPFLSAPTPSRTSRFAPGQTIASRFTVVRYIARGGMGEVYEVEDRFLQGVHVALKMIRPEIACNEGSSSRFEQEVLLARKVTHKNLCPIYDIARSDDVAPPLLFLTMKLLEGETLSARLRRPEPIPREEKVAIFRQLMAGVSAIHAAGVLHRDIKPNNVMLENSGAEVSLSIMDFGLARLHEPNSTGAMTHVVAGTPGYIAPEILGGQAPSQAADLFAVGVLLHQVAIGEYPRFDPVSLSVEPSIALDKADVPPIFINAVRDFLSSEPERRCESARTITAELDGPPRSQRALVGAICVLLLLVSLLLVPAVGERVRGMLFASSEKHIAVLPFDLAGNNPETQALGDGLMDSLAGKLSNMDANNQALWVVPAKEVRTRKVTDATSAFHEFGATLVVEGSFERVNEVTHLKLTLIDSRKLKEIGFVDVQNQTGDMGALQDQAVTRLGRLMNISAKEGPTTKAEASVSRGAYEDYLLALGYAQRFDRPGNLDLAVTSLQNALKTDPGFTLGVARLAQVYVLKYRLDKNPAWLDQAKQYAEQALQSDSRVALAHVALGQVEQYTGHHDLAAQEYQRAIDLDPKDPDALTGLALSDRDLGRNSEAEAIYIRAANLHPDDWSGYNNLGQFYERIGRPRDAIREFRKAIDLAPDNSGVYANLGVAYLNIGDSKMMSAAEEALNKSIAISPTYRAYTNLAVVYATQNRYADSVATIKQALKLNDQDYKVWINLAEGYEWLGDEKNATDARHKAQELLERGIKVNSQNADAQATLAVILAKEGLRSEALNKIHISLALEPRDQSILADVADAYELLGNRRLARLYLQQAILNGLPVADLRTDPYARNLISDPQFHPPKG